MASVNRKKYYSKKNLLNVLLLLTIMLRHTREIVNLSFKDWCLAFIIGDVSLDGIFPLMV